ADEYYDLGDLVSELDLELDRGGRSPAPGVTTSARDPSDSIDISLDGDDEEVELPGAYTTQEIAFDDVAAAIEEVVPRDESGKALQLSDQDLVRARQRRPSLAKVSGAPDDAGNLSDTPPLRV